MQTTVSAAGLTRESHVITSNVAEAKQGDTVWFRWEVQRDNAVFDGAMVIGPCIFQRMLINDIPIPMTQLTQLLSISKSRPFKKGSTIQVEVLVDGAGALLAAELRLLWYAN